MNTAIRKLRQSLGDEADNPRFIETLSRRGYRFVAPVMLQARALGRQSERVAVAESTAEADSGAASGAAVQNLNLMIGADEASAVDLAA